MKARLLIGIAALAFCATACQDDETALNQGNSVSGTFTAVMEQPIDARSAVTDEGTFSWTEGDKITVISSDGTVTTPIDLTVTEGKGTFELSDVKDPAYALYPQLANNEYTSGKFSLPTTYNDYNGSTNAAMFANMTNITKYDTDEVKFRHLAGVLRIKFKSVPTGCDQLIFTATDKKITGDFSVDMSDATPQITLGENEGSGTTVTFNFTAKDTYESMTFYVPLPVGEYGELIIQLKNTTSGDTFTQKTSATTKTMDLRTLALLPEITDLIADEKTETADGLYYSIDGGAYLPYPTTLGNEFVTAKTIKIKTVGDNTYFTPDQLYELMSSQPASLEVLDLKDAIYKDNDSEDAHVAFPSHRTSKEYSSPFSINWTESKLSKIIVPDNTTKIYVGASSATLAYNVPFKYVYNNSSVLPNLTTIEWNIEKVTVLDCHMLTGYDGTVNIPSLKNITKIGEKTFYRTRNEGDIDLSNCTEIGKDAFYPATNITSITFGKNVTIGDSGFRGAKQLAHITGWDKIISIGDYAFAGTSLVDIDGKDILDFSKSMVEEVGAHAFESVPVSSIIIGGTLKKIHEAAFKGMYSLSSVDFTNANSELEIGPGAFQAGTSATHALTSVAVNAKTMHPTAFVALNSLSKLTLSEGLTDNEGGTFTQSEEGILFNGDKTKLHTFPTCNEALTTYEIPANITSIGYMAFYTNHTLTKISFAQRKENSNEVELVKTYETGTNAAVNKSSTFNGMAELVEMDMSDVVITYLWEQCFNNCKKLETVSLPQGLKTIYDKAFNNCIKLKTIKCTSNVPPTLTGTPFPNTCGSELDASITKKVIYPKDCKAAYEDKNSIFYTTLRSLGYTFEEKTE